MGCVAHESGCVPFWPSEFVGNSESDLGLEVVTDSASEARTTNHWFRLLHPTSARDIAYMG